MKTRSTARLRMPKKTTVYTDANVRRVLRHRHANRQKMDADRESHSVGTRFRNRDYAFHTRGAGRADDQKRKIRVSLFSMEAAEAMRAVLIPAT